MKIAINGTIIDTKDIYQISELLEPSIYEFDDSEFGDCDERDWMHRFKIFFFNKTIKVITIYDGKKSISLEEFKAFRDSIVKIWFDNQPEIPQFNF